MLKYLYITALLLFFYSCKTVKPVPFYNYVTDTFIVEHVRDTTIVVPADSAFIYAWFYCDSARNVLLKELVTISGRTVKPEIVYRDRFLQIKIPVDSQAIYQTIRNRETVIYKHATMQEPEKSPGKPFPRMLIAFAIVMALFAMIQIFRALI
jgi:hypothetical protein